ncbi:hypothetical protein BS47DRAFT_1481236 [Hydnum rufescens UP504]|uniref:Pentatricopeptide repeat-containing protein n=1 Tax=Hydnum rufescens UP504 TaxID=1448309 RepID=A0A9P6DZV2_9AGAM|nr:hypothetical protein BS47DRAFT_1481236 [Hydnum rufescens UP504]
MPFLARMHTPAQVSRLAAKIIRQSFMAGQIQDACDALSNLHARTLDYYNPKPSSAASVNFSLGPSPLRLPTTTLVHGLLRVGLSHKASTVIVDTMNGHVPVRSHKILSALALEHRVRFRVQTLESVVAALCPPAGSGISVQGPLVKEVSEMRRLERASIPPRFKHAQGITLLNLFRQHRYRRSKEMYDRVIDACLLQGEIITACLLFVLLVKDWQVRSVLRQARAHPEPPKGPDNLSIEPGTPHPPPPRGLFWSGKSNDSLVYISPDDTHLPVTHVAKIPLDRIISLGLHDQSLYIPPPPNDSLLKIVRHLNLYTSSELFETSSDLDVPDPHTSLQGRLASPKDSLEVLEYLVHLLHERALPDSRISSLISVMCSIRPNLTYYVDRVPLLPLRRRKIRTRHPPTSGKVPPTEPSPYDSFSPRLRPLPTIDFRKQVSLYAFSNAVLLDLISSPPSPPDSDSISTHMLPVLDRRSYNALLHYALRNRKSPELAQKVLDNMQERGRGIDTVTANIILRDMALLRLNADVRQAMALFFPASQVAAEAHGADDDGPTDSSMSEPGSDSSHQPSTSEQTGPTSPSLPTLVIPPRKARDPVVSPDKYTLTSILAYRTSSGIHFRDALQLLRTSMPLLSGPATLSRSSTTVVSSMFRRTDVQHPHKASTMIPTFSPSMRTKPDFTGPLSYTVLLNMLAKAGLLLKAEKLFWHAKRAERRSWKLGRARFLATLQSRGGSFSHREGPMWRPWCLPIEAYTVMIQCYATERRSRLLPPPQGEGWRNDLAHRTYWEVMGGARRVYDSLSILHELLADDNIHGGGRDRTPTDYRKAARHWGLTYALGGSIPVPDARFFNAALQMFARHEWYDERQASKGRNDRVHPLSHTYLAPHRTDDAENYRMLERIAVDMQRFGYPVPEGVSDVLRHRGAGLEPRLASAIAYSVPQAVHPFRIPAPKARGLPHRRHGGEMIRAKRRAYCTSRQTIRPIARSGVISRQ